MHAIFSHILDRYLLLQITIIVTIHDDNKFEQRYLNSKHWIRGQDVCCLLVSRVILIYYHGPSRLENHGNDLVNAAKVSIDHLLPRYEFYVILYTPSDPVQVGTECWKNDLMPFLKRNHYNHFTYRLLYF